MALMKAILDRLPTLRNSQDFATAALELKERLGRVQAEADGLKAAHEDALFGNPAALNDVKSKIAANQAEQEELRIAIAGAERRRREAVEAEKNADLEKRAGEARRVQKLLLGQYCEINEHLVAVGDLLKSINEGESVLLEYNAFINASESARKDHLRVPSPLSHLPSVYEERQRARVSFEAGHVRRLSIQGYFPPHPDGPALSRMKQVKL
ncbi:MAG: hypothetical protein R3D51_19520 [Hyphomicrobiaceae bacterium]